MIPPVQKTAAYRLFHHKYRFRVPKALMYGPEYLNNVGYAISGDPVVDSGSATEILTVNQCGAGIAILFSQGAPLDFVDHKDSILLYNDIQEHLKDWERVSRGNIPLSAAPPLEDFRMLEAVGRELYSTVKHNEPVEVSGDRMRDAIIAMDRRRNPRMVEAAARSRNADEGGGLKPYVSIVDRIEENLLGDY